MYIHRKKADLILGQTNIIDASNLVCDMNAYRFYNNRVAYNIEINVEYNDCVDYKIQRTTFINIWNVLCFHCAII